MDKQKSSLVKNRSGYLVMWPVIAGLFVLCIITFIYEKYFFSGAALFVGLIMLASRLWAEEAAKKLQLNISADNTGVFCGESIHFTVQVKNNKFLPVMSPELYFPLSKNQGIIPECIRQVEDYEKLYLKEMNASEENVGTETLPNVMWYESRTYKSVWKAKKRGLYSNKNWKIRTGDGFGLARKETGVHGDNVFDIAIYPEIIPVNNRIFFKSSWNFMTGIKGIIEDKTVIRSTREYITGDSVKNINWRLTARGLPLNVNVYEEIQPQTAYFIFDGESFAADEKHPDELEKALSITASLIVSLEGRVQCGISFIGDCNNNIINIPIGSDLENILWAFAAYNPSMQDIAFQNSGVHSSAAQDFGMQGITAQTSGTQSISGRNSQKDSCYSKTIPQEMVQDSENHAPGTQNISKENFHKDTRYSKTTTGETAQNSAAYTSGIQNISEGNSHNDNQYEIKTVREISEIRESLPSAVRIYFVTYDADSAAGEIMDVFSDDGGVTVITYKPPVKNHGTDVFCIQDLLV